MTNDPLAQSLMNALGVTTEPEDSRETETFPDQPLASLRDQNVGGTWNPSPPADSLEQSLFNAARISNI